MQTFLKLSLAAALFCTVGCQKKQETVKLEPSESAGDEDLDWQESLYAMSDNAAQYDLSMHDIHFVPHTTELNGLGARRLDQLARVMEPYGGTIRYQTSSTDTAVMETRLQHIRDYLAATGRNVSKIQVLAGPSAGRGIKAGDALQAKANAFAKEDGGSTSSISSGSSSSPGSMLNSSGQ